MPFTFSHPAIIIPLRKWFSFTGLIFGSMSPDFEYFLKMRISNLHGHTFWGVFCFDLLISIIIAFIFHNIIRNQLIKNLPDFFNSRFNHINDFNWNKYFSKHWLIVIISIIIGASSHIFWDSFTHDTGFFVKQIPFLQEKISFRDYSFPVLKILQHFSTVIGALYIFYFIYKLPKNNSNSKFSKFNYWFSIFSLMIVFVVIKLWLQSFSIAIGNLIVSCITCLFLAILLISMINWKSYNIR